MLRKAALWLFASLLVPSAIAAQIDIPITTVGPVRTLVRNATWAGSGVGGVNNNYLLTPSFTNEGACLYVTNNDTSAHAFSLQFFGTGDPTVKAYQNNTAAWKLQGPVGNLLGQFFASVPASSVSSYFVQVSGQARIAVIVSGGASTGTATLNLVESSANNQGCGNTQALPPFCSYTINYSVGTGTQFAVQGATGQAIYVCGVWISASAALAAGNIELVFSANPLNCLGTQTIMFALLTAASSPVYIPIVGNPLIGRFNANQSLPGLDLAGQALCIVNNQATTVEVDVSYAQF